MARKFLSGIDAGDQKIVSVADPTTAGDAANKKYVDDVFAFPPSAPLYGQIARMTSGTITVATQGVYQSTGLLAVLDGEADGISLGTTDTFAVKNTSGVTRRVKIAASYDASMGGATKVLGAALAINGAVDLDTECRATTGLTGAIAKLFTSWIIDLPDGDEVALFVANHTDTGDISFERGRVVCTAVAGYGPPGIEIGATEPVDTDVLWADTSEPGDAVIPVGGATGQALVKVSGSDYDTDWASTVPDPTGEAAGQVAITDGADGYVLGLAGSWVPLQTLRLTSNQATVTLEEPTTDAWADYHVVRVTATIGVSGGGVFRTPIITVNDLASYVNVTATSLGGASYSRVQTASASDMTFTNAFVGGDTGGGGQWTNMVDLYFFRVQPSGFRLQMSGIIWGLASFNTMVTSRIAGSGNTPIRKIVFALAAENYTSGSSFTVQGLVR